MMIAIPWLKLATCALLIGLAGPILTHYADIISRLTGLSRTWIGLALLATATSLPELFTGVSAVTAAGMPDIAVGDALGSCLFNLLMLVLLDALSRDEPVYRRVDQAHILTAGFGVILIGSVGALLLVARNGLELQIWHVSVFTPLIVILYFVAMRAAFVYEHRVARPQQDAGEAVQMSLATAIIRYSAAALVVAAAGIWLPFVAKELAEVMGWQSTFVGTMFVAATTSLPELVVTISALRFGSVNLAVGNLLGSNLFAVLVLAIDDIAYLKGPLLGSVSPAHAVTAFAAVVMSGIFVVATLYRPETRLRGTIGWVSISLLIVYFLSSYAVYLFQG